MSVSWSSYNISLLSTTGVFVQALDTFTNLQMTRTVNNVGALSITGLPYSDHLWNACKKDAIIDVWRHGASGGTQRVMGAIWLITGRQIILDATGMLTIALTGADQLEILRRYVVLFDTGTAQAQKVGTAEHVIKGFVSDNLLTANSALSRPGLSQYVAMEPESVATANITAVSGPAAVSAISVGSPTQITCGANIPSGVNVTLVGTHSTPSINKTYVATNVNATTFSVPVAVTVSGPTYAISKISVGSPTQITCNGDGVPGNPGATASVTISGSNSTPSINGTYTATRVVFGQFTIHVNVTTAGTQGSANFSGGAGGEIEYPPIITCATKVISETTVQISGCNALPSSINGSYSAQNIDATHFMLPLAGPMTAAGNKGKVTVDSGRGYNPSAIAASWQGVLSVCTQVARASTQYLSYVAFDLDVVGTGPLQFVFRVYSGQRGVDRTPGSLTPLVLSAANGSLGAATYGEDYSASASFSLCGGQTISGTTQTGSAVDPLLDIAGPFAHTEIYVAQQLSIDPDTLATQANDSLRLNRPVLDVSNVTINQSADLQMGTDFGFGDAVTVRMGAVSVLARIESLTVIYDASSGQETISGSLRSEYSP